MSCLMNLVINIKQLLDVYKPNHALRSKEEIVSLDLPESWDSYVWRSQLHDNCYENVNVRDN